MSTCKMINYRWHPNTENRTVIGSDTNKSRRNIDDSGGKNSCGKNKLALNHWTSNGRTQPIPASQNSGACQQMQTQSARHWAHVHDSNGTEWTSQQMPGFLLPRIRIRSIDVYLAYQVQGRNNSSIWLEHLQSFCNLLNWQIPPLFLLLL